MNPTHTTHRAATQGSNASLCVLKVPELLSLICSFSRTSDCARLARTSRQVFKVSVGYVWNNVDGAQNLLMLLGGTRAIYHTKSPGLKKIMVGMASNQVDFSRFDIYAPFVRRLNVYGMTVQHYQVSGWHPLNRRSQSRPLLPNLVSLNLQAASDISGLDQIMWIQTFLSPSLVNIQVAPVLPGSPQGSTFSYTPRISPLATSVILQSIVERCPKLMRLSLFMSEALVGDPHDGETPLLSCMWKKPFYEHLHDLPLLTELTCTTLMLEHDSLGVLGSIPQLRRLIVHTSAGAPLRSQTIPDSCFPALKQLHLRGVNPYDIIVILNITPMMRQLVTLELKFHPDGIDEDEDRDEWLAQSLLTLLKHTPCLSFFHLELDINPALEEPYDIGDQDVMDTFSKLPLISLTLSGVHISDWARTGSLRTVWPNVTNLCMKNQFASPLILSCFSQLPKLQHLTLNICLEDFVAFPKVPSVCPLTTLEFSREASTVYEPEHLEYTTRFLLALFPKLKRVVWPEDKTNEAPEHVAQYRFIGFLNAHLSVRRELEELRARVSRQW